MKLYPKLILSVLLLCIAIVSYAQDTTFTTAILKCTYDKANKCPKIIQYKLYKGGGDCKRETLHTFTAYPFTGNNHDYVGSHYDKGHMANAEDFAYDCTLEALTFECYNIIPQSHTLNAGIFKINETKTRQLSQSDSLLITYLNTISHDFIGNGVHKVKNTYKIVQSLTTKQILYCLKFADLPNISEINVSVNQILFETGYKFYLK